MLEGWFLKKLHANSSLLSFECQSLSTTHKIITKKKYSKEFKQKIIKEVDFCLAGTEKIQQNWRSLFDSQSTEVNCLKTYIQNTVWVVLKLLSSTIHENLALYSSFHVAHH